MDFDLPVESVNGNSNWSIEDGNQEEQEEMITIVEEIDKISEAQLEAEFVEKMIRKLLEE